MLTIKTGEVSSCCDQQREDWEFEPFHRDQSAHKLGLHLDHEQRACLRSWVQAIYWWVDWNYKKETIVSGYCEQADQVAAAGLLGPDEGNQGHQPIHHWKNGEVQLQYDQIQKRSLTAGRWHYQRAAKEEPLN